VTPDLVPAGVETVPVTHSGDAADDPALWIHPTDPASSLLIGNDKQGALEVYNMDGSSQQHITAATSFWGNVDVRQQVTIGGTTRDVVAAYNSGLRMFNVDVPSRMLQLTTDGPGYVNTGGGEGLCLYKSAVTGQLSAFVITIAGRVRQYVIGDADADGLLEATLAREFQVGSEAEGCVADDVSGAVYISQEDVALWRYGAEPNAGTARIMVDAVQPTGHIANDSEGVTIVDVGGGAGYVIASAQNVSNPTQSYFSVYDRQTNAFVKTFRIVNGASADGCSRTDGITAYVGNLGPSFPSGAFVCQDDSNTTPGAAGNQDFKLTRVETVVDLAAVGGNASPQASFTVGCTELTCTFDASASSDTDGTVASYTWDFGDGTSGSGQTTPHTYSAAGERTVTLNVRDDDNAFGATTRVASPTGPPEPLSFVVANSTMGNRTSHPLQIPTAVHTGDQLLAFFTANNTATITGPSGWTQERATSTTGIITRLWSKRATSADAGSTITVTTSATVKAGLNVAAYRGVATNGIGATAVRLETTTMSAHVTPTVDVVDEGDWLVSYWADKSPSTTTWTTPTDQTVRSTSAGSSTGHISTVITDTAGPIATGTQGGLTATANSSGSRAAMFSIALRTAALVPPVNQPPTASFTVSCLQLTCSVDASASFDSDGTIVSYAWDFGDTATDTGKTASHTYADAGPRTVTLTVTDDDTATGSTTRQANPTTTTSVITFVAANTANGNKLNHTITIPASVQAGDALVLFFAGNTETPTITGPTGWTLEQSVAPSGVVGKLWSKVAGAGDAGTTVTVASSAYIKADLSVAAYRGTAASPVGASAVTVDAATATNHTTPTVSVATAGDWLVSYWADKSSSTTAWTSIAGQQQRGTSTTTGGGHMTAVLADSAGSVPVGTAGGLTATANAAGSKAVMFSVVLSIGP
jgi:myo-inositol-hexaphosphate 3-phosphohydrolase